MAVRIDVIEFIEGRRVDYSEHWSPILDESDVDGEFAVAGDELLGAVDRIDEKEASLAASSVGDFVLFRDDWYVGRKLAERLDYHPFGGDIGLSHRRTVGLPAARKIARVDFENDASGPAGGTDEPAGQPLAVGGWRFAR